MAEFYGIHNWREFPLNYVATLAIGLSDNSRTKRAISGNKIGVDTMILASIADRLGLLCWLNTEDARKGRNRPKSILDELLREPTRAKQKYRAFANGADFDAAWAKMTNKGN